MEINSVNNHNVILATKLKHKKYRIMHKKYLIFGNNIVKMAVDKSQVEMIFATEQLLIDQYIKIKSRYLINQEIMKKILDGSNSNICAIVKIVDQTTFDDGHVIVLDRISDPGNLGTIIRSAKAFGFNNIYLGDECVDLYNSKVLRSIQGANYYLNIKQGSLKSYLDKSNLRLVTTFIDEDSNYTHQSNIKYNILFGNEGSGIDPMIKKYDHQNLKLEIDFESLNVAVASSIIMYKIKMEV